MKEEDTKHIRGLAWGLDLDSPDVTTAEEIAEFRRISALSLHGQQDGLEYWVENQPEVLKRYRAWADQLRIRTADEAQRWVPGSIGVLFHYAMYGFTSGLRYNITSFSCRLFTKTQMLELIALIFRYVGPRGMASIAETLKGLAWPEPAEPVKWPVGWAPDPEAFRSGVDFSDPSPSPADTRKILDWYERWLGETPRHIRLLARHRPDLLKAFRQRYENTLRVVPKQVEAHALIQLSIQRGHRDGIREGVLLARGFGMSRRDVLEAMSWGTFYGGLESLGAFDEVAGDLIESWPAGQAG